MIEELRKIIDEMEDKYSSHYTDDYISSEDLLLLIKGVPKLIDENIDLYSKNFLLQYKISKLESELKESDELTEKYFDKYMKLKRKREGESSDK